MRTEGREVTTLVLFDHEGLHACSRHSSIGGDVTECGPGGEAAHSNWGRVWRSSAAFDDPSRSFPPNAEWDIAEMPAMPLNVGLAMVRLATRERYIRYREFDSDAGYAAQTFRTTSREQMASSAVSTEE